MDNIPAMLPNILVVLNLARHCVTLRFSSRLSDRTGATMRVLPSSKPSSFVISSARSHAASGLVVLLAILLSGCGEEEVAPAPTAGANKPSQDTAGLKERNKRKTQTSGPKSGPQVQMVERDLGPFAPKANWLQQQVPGRDPFYGFIDEIYDELAKAPVDTVVIPEAVPLEPLQRFPLAQLKLVATITSTSVPKAQVVDPTGQVHMVNEGQPIGTANGRIQFIREGEVRVLQRAVDSVQGSKLDSGAKQCVLMRLSPSVDAIIERTQRANATTLDDAPAEEACEVISFYSAELDGAIELTVER